MRIRSIALALVSLPLTVAGLLVGCGGDDSNAVVDGGGGNDASVNDSGGNGDTGNPNPDGSTTTDSGTPDGSTTTDGGAASNPGKITCGSTECDSTTQVCCSKFSFDAGTTRTCTAPNACQGGTASHCDEKADCPQNQKCCLGFGGAQCQNNCQGPELCKTNLECGDGGTCSTYTCPQNVTVQTCSKPIGCN